MLTESVSKKIFKGKALFLFFSLIFILYSLFIIPVHVSAHEVYVLTPGEIQTALSEPSVSPITVITNNMELFFVWAFIVPLAVIVIFFISISARLEKMFGPFLIKIKRYAPIISRVTVGLSFVAAAYYRASYGPELPLSGTYGSYTPFIVGLLYVIGVLIILGLWVRFASAIALGLFAVSVYFHGTYMLTYVNYLGEIILLLLAGAGAFALQKSTLKQVAYKKIEKYGFLILRVFFGIALIFASAYAKLIHSNLGLDTVLKYHLNTYIPFEPHFLVLGAAIIEILIGLFFILGIEIRFTAVFLLFWLTLSLIFFGEVVWPHIILIGIPIALFCYGYDEYSLEGYFFKHGDREPVL
jgi:uncharacterized membrane protein YphA (DoxX/SURF4 family)